MTHPAASLEPVVPPAVSDALDRVEDAWFDLAAVGNAVRKRRAVSGEAYNSEATAAEQEECSQASKALRSSISDALREATRAERERCAKVICMACHYGMLHENGECTAAAIRRSPTSDATNGR